jgi:hypothetical protein
MLAHVAGHGISQRIEFDESRRDDALRMGHIAMH